MKSKSLRKHFFVFIWHGKDRQSVLSMGKHTTSVKRGEPDYCRPSASKQVTIKPRAGKNQLCQPSAGKHVISVKHTKFTIASQAWENM